MQETAIPAIKEGVRYIHEEGMPAAKENLKHFQAHNRPLSDRLLHSVVGKSAYHPSRSHRSCRYEASV